MKNLYTVVILGVAMALPTVAPGDELANKYFSKYNPPLTAQEKASIAIAKRWKAGKALRMKPVAGADGSVRFLFGAQQPSIVCAVLQVCDVALQPGEQVKHVNVGDKLRWTIEPAISGSWPDEIQHLQIKPFDVGLKTSLVVTTNRRTYHFKLRSTRKKYMQNTSFIYPEDALAKWDAIRTKGVRKRTENTIPQTGEYLGELDFEYDLQGSVSWKPLRVYNNGLKTIIQMPSAMAQTEAPTLLVVRKEGGLFSDDEAVMINYRVQNDRYIVDKVFDKAILIAGVGNSQDRVTITRRK